MKQRKAVISGAVSETSESGMALVMTLMILALITSLVVEFAYGVYTTTAALQNWKDSQRLSLSENIAGGRSTV
jgi:hypothetical protein